MAGSRSHFDSLLTHAFCLFVRLVLHSCFKHVPFYFCPPLLLLNVWHKFHFFLPEFSWSLPQSQMIWTLVIFFYLRSSSSWLAIPWVFTSEYLHRILQLACSASSAIDFVSFHLVFASLPLTAIINHLHWAEIAHQYCPKIWWNLEYLLQKDERRDSAWA